jgi:hypothetical protein
VLLELRLRVVEVAGSAAALAPRHAGDAAPRRWFLGALARLLAALRDPQLAALAAPGVPGATLPLGARVPGTSYELEPASAAASLGALLYDDAPGPIDAVAPALAVADWAARRAHYAGCTPPRVAALHAALALAEAVRGALDESPSGGDPWFASRVAGAVAAAQLLGADLAQRREAALAAALDGSPATPAALRAAYDDAAAAERALRHAAGENAARAVRHALAACCDADGPRRPRAVPGSPGATAGAAHDAAGVALEPLPTDADDDDTHSLAPVVLGFFPERQARAILAMLADAPRLAALGVDACVARLVRN